MRGRAVTAEDAGASTRPPIGRSLALYSLKVAAFSIAYAAAAIFGLTWSVVPGAGTPIWPASGLAFAVLVLGGVRLWPGILIGRLAAAIILGSPQPLWAATLIASASVLGGVAPALVLRRMRSFDPSLSTLGHVVAVAAAAVASAALSAGPAMPVLWLTGTPAAQIPTTMVNWVLGNIGGVLIVSPLLLAWSRLEAWRMSRGHALHLALCLAVTAGAAYFVFIRSPFTPTPTWYLIPVLVWPALAFNVKGAAPALAIMAAFAVWSAEAAVGPFASVPAGAAARLLLSQQFVAIITLTMLVLAAVADERRGRRKILESEARLKDERRVLETLNATGAAIAAELELDAVVQTVTDAGVELTGARFGAFFYNVVGPEGESYTLFSLSGAPRSSFERFGMPRNTDVFAPTFEGTGVVRSADITADPRYGRNAPHRGMPKGHLPVRSYLATPVRSRSGVVIGGLFFGHPEVGVFTERAEWIVKGIAAQAAIALDNARLYQAAQSEIAERRRIEAHQDLLINELNHRVKNTLATVQSIAVQSLRSPMEGGQAKDALMARLIALSKAHDVITARTWQGADLGEIVRQAAEAFDDEAGSRFHITGPDVWLEPKAALAVAMALHELGTNAAKYGSLSAPGGTVAILWTWDPANRRLGFTWTERGGPKVSAPKTRGFGSRLLERGLKSDLGGEARLDYAKEGLACEIVAILAAPRTPRVDAFSGGSPQQAQA